MSYDAAWYLIVFASRPLLRSTTVSDCSEEVHQAIHLTYGIYLVYPPTQDSSRKWRFRLGFPILKMEYSLWWLASWVGGQPKVFIKRPIHSSTECFMLQKDHHPPQKVWRLTHGGISDVEARGFAEFFWEAKRQVPNKLSSWNSKVCKDKQKNISLCLQKLTHIFSTLLWQLFSFKCFFFVWTLFFLFSFFFWGGWKVQQRILVKPASSVKVPQSSPPGHATKLSGHAECEESKRQRLKGMIRKIPFVVPKDGHENLGWPRTNHYFGGH